MFSEECIVPLADGSTKSISAIVPGDLIINKLLKVVKVRAVTSTTGNAVAVQLNNGTGVFYTDPTARFLCHYINGDSHTSHWDSISTINTHQGWVKSSMKIFSPETNVSISSYDASNTSLTKTLYTIQNLNDNTNSYFVNGVIVSCTD